jgi:hypothetical protein
MLKAGFMLLLALTFTSAKIGSVVPGTNGDLVYKDGVWDAHAIAWGNYSDWTKHKSGFGVLNIKTKDSDSTGGTYGDATQMKAAGLLEGMLTMSRIENHHANMRSWMLGQLGKNMTDFPQVFKDFMKEQDTWMRSQIALHADNATKSSDASTWRHVGLVLSQFDGLVQATEASGINQFEMQMLNGLGDFFDLLPALMPSSAPFARWAVENGLVLAMIAPNSCPQSYSQMLTEDVEVDGVSRMMEYVLEHGGVLPTHLVKGGNPCVLRQASHKMPKTKMRPVVLEVSIYLMELVVLRS